MQNINFVQTCKRILEKLAPYWHPVFNKSDLAQKDIDNAPNVCNAIKNDVQQMNELAQMTLVKEIRVCPYPALKIDSKIAVVGDLILMKPDNPEYEGKTYLGYFLGEIALGSTVKVDAISITSEFVRFSPVFYLPEIGRWFFGIDGWWSLIKQEQDFEKITLSNPDSSWYIELAKSDIRRQFEKREREAKVAQQSAKNEKEAAAKQSEPKEHEQNQK
jgi:hypothetical protein